MATSVSWPATLPLPAIAGYGLKPKPNVVRTEMEDGAARQRRRSTVTVDPITVQFELTAWQEMMFDAWLDKRANGGATWFNITLLSGRGLESYEARIKGGADRDDRPRNGANWVATLTLEVRNRPMLSDSDIDLLIGEDGDALLAAINALHLYLTTSRMWGT